MKTRTNRRGRKSLSRLHEEAKHLIQKTRATQRRAWWSILRVKVSLKRAKG